MSSSTPERFALWEQRLEEGVKAEALVAMTLTKAGWWVLTGNKTSAYDFAAFNHARLFLVELKDESRYEGSKNLCIETRQGAPGKASGISTSESSICVHVFGESCALYKTQRMRLFLKVSSAAGLYRQKPFKGADNSNVGILLPIEDVVREPWFDFTALTKLADSRVWRAA